MKVLRRQWSQCLANFSHSEQITVILSKTKNVVLGRHSVKLRTKGVHSLGSGVHFPVSCSWFRLADSPGSGVILNQMVSKNRFLLGLPGAG